ncbi:MAG: glucans biosynthesis glucosyltransferase MdoH [Betaproteobacteria bacterium]|nr:glucans biosynthesis glucosyltransferase MdoH [Betaproteobacteria bacterium]
MELRPAPELAGASARLECCERYVNRLPLAPERRRELLQQVAACRGGDAGEAMTELHQALAGQPVDRENPAYDSVRRRLALAYGVPQTEAGPVIATDVHQRPRLFTVPPFNRASMAPPLWLRERLFRLFRSRAAEPPRAGSADSPDPRGHWHRAAALRRATLAALVLAQTIVATDFMTRVLPYQGRQPLEIVILVLFAILFGWISAGFWTAMAGFFLRLRGGDRYSISRTAADNAPIGEAARTAVIMPICNENVARVFSGLRASYESLARTGELRHFDFFVLSDTSEPDTRVAETEAWLEMCRAVNGYGRVFYRWRQHRIKRKSGNVADFCRRWGRNYRYMVVLDADSVMSGKCLTKLVRLMEANPNAGIIQTAPHAAGRDTLYARIQQFATGIYGPLFTAGLHFWQLGESHYWGHNAILRVAPFMRHCGLGRLPGRGALSGEILSHDFVEAALMRRAGWAVWMAYDLPGSYEEMPPNLVDELKRDRRWCLGNLMNFRLFLMKGLHPAHRVVFMTGVMAYLSAPLWFMALVASTALLAVHTLSVPEYFVEPYQLFPLWPEWRPGRAIALFSTTAVLLFLPKILSVLLMLVQGARRFGGGVHLTLSMLAELIYSALLAPIRMLFHTQFVVAALLGRTVQWKSPPREDAETTWGEALRRHGWHTVLGIVWAAGVYWLNPSFLWWLLPVVGALILSIPLSVYSSRTSLGRRLRRVRFFMIPEESWPPKEIRWARKGVKHAAKPPGFVEAVVDPVVNALACSSGVARLRPSNAIRNERRRLVRAALIDGPNALSAREKMTLLNDPLALSRLHFQVWVSTEAAPRWRTARET